MGSKIAENKNEKFPEENCKKKEAMKVNRTSESMNWKGSKVSKIIFSLSLKGTKKMLYCLFSPLQNSKNVATGFSLVLCLMIRYVKPEI